MNGGLLVKILPKGQITIPVKFRRQLGVEEQSYLRVALEEGRLVIKPVKSNWEEKYIRKYSNDEIEEFLEADKLSPKERQAARQWLRKVQ